MDRPEFMMWVQSAALLLARLAPVVVLTPLFGGQATPRRFRFAVVLLLSLTLLPLVLDQSSASRPVAGFVLVGLLIKEAVVGLTIAFLVNLIFDAFSSFGYLADTARGATFANVLDPMSQQQQSVLSVFFVQLAVCVFLASGGYRSFISTIAGSLDRFPPFLPAPDSLVGGRAADTVIELSTVMLTVAFKLAAPVLIVMLLIDVALGIINRVAPNFQAYFVGMTLKGTAGLLVVFAGVALTFDSVLPDLVSLLYSTQGEFGE